MPILRESQIRQAMPRDKAYKLYDSRGLYLMVSTSGAKLWRFKCHFGPAERLLVIGKYPDVTLQRARDKRDAARRLLVDGIDPAIQKQAQKHALANSFGEIALEWLAHQRHAFTPKTFAKATWTINDLLLPFIGKRPITELTHLELLNVFRRLEKRGKNETAHRTRQRCGQIFRYAIATGRATRDLTLDLRGALAPVVTKNHAAVTEPAEIGRLLLAIDSYRGHPATEIALKFAPLVFVRPGELRQAEWTEFDFNGAEWRIPAHKMKMREMHIVPLARQAVEPLRELDPITNRQRYVFSCLRGGDQRTARGRCEVSVQNDHVCRIAAWPLLSHDRSARSIRMLKGNCPLGSRAACQRPDRIGVVPKRVVDSRQAIATDGGRWTWENDWRTRN